MALVKVKGKYQVTLPAKLRAQVGVSVGDVLEVKVRGNTISLVPKSVVDRDAVKAFPGSSGRQLKGSKGR